MARALPLRVVCACKTYVFELTDLPVIGAEVSAHWASCPGGYLPVSEMDKRQDQDIKETAPFHCPAELHLEKQGFPHPASVWPGARALRPPPTLSPLCFSVGLWAPLKAPRWMTDPPRNWPGRSPAPHAAWAPAPWCPSESVRG